MTTNMQSPPLHKKPNGVFSNAVAKALKISGARNKFATAVYTKNVHKGANL